MAITTDVLVAGLGAMGSAALYQVAKKGVRTIGIDRFTPPHSFGSSHGDTRIVRQVTGNAIEYTPLALRAYEIWRELEKETNRTLLTKTGGIIVENEGDLSHQKQSSYLSITEEAACKYHISHEMLSPSDLRKQFPQFNFCNNERGYYEHDAGFLRPELCIEAQLSLAQKRGAQINFNERILKCTPLGRNAVSIKTDKTEYNAQKLIVAAGPWMADFFPEYGKLFKVCRQVLYWFDIAGDSAPYQPGTFPVFIIELPDKTAFYGFPAVDGARGGLKVASENYSVTTKPDHTDRTVSQEETKSMYEKFVRPYLPQLSNHCLKAVTCLYTLTPDLNFIIDVCPDFSQIIIASPCSGHGFKYSAAIGEALAELALQQKTSVNIDKFKLARFKTVLP